MNSTATLEHKVVSKNEWLRACGDFLAKEKELTRMSDELSRQRRELPWTKSIKQFNSRSVAPIWFTNFSVRVLLGGLFA